MSSFMTNIDYDALAAALLKVGLGPGVAGGVAGVGVEVDRGDNRAGTVKSAKSEVTGGVGWSGGDDVVVVVEQPDVESGESVAGDASEVDGGVGDGSRSESGESIVSGGGIGVVSAEVKQKVKFGGFSDHFEPVSGAGTIAQGGGFYGSVVRSGNAKALREMVAKLCGAKLPKVSFVDFAICTFTAGVMPASVFEGKKRLNGLAALGDAVITTHLVADAVSKGGDVESAQALRSKVTSNDNLRRVFRRVGMMSCVSFAPGVDPVTSKASATAFEAVVGTLAMYRDAQVVRRFLLSCKLLG